MIRLPIPFSSQRPQNRFNPRWQSFAFVWLASLLSAGTLGAQIFLPRIAQTSQFAAQVAVAAEMAHTPEPDPFNGCFYYDVTELRQPSGCDASDGRLKIEIVDCPELGEEYAYAIVYLDNPRGPQRPVFTRFSGEEAIVNGLPPGRFDVYLQRANGACRQTHATWLSGVPNRIKDIKFRSGVDPLTNPVLNDQAPPGGNIQWERQAYSAPDGPWRSIPGANSLDYDPARTGGGQYVYRRRIDVAGASCPPSYSNRITRIPESEFRKDHLQSTYEICPDECSGEGIISTKIRGRYADLDYVYYFSPNVATHSFAIDVQNIIPNETKPALRINRAGHYDMRFRIYDNVWDPHDAVPTDKVPFFIDPGFFTDANGGLLQQTTFEYCNDEGQVLPRLSGSAPVCTGTNQVELTPAIQWYVADNSSDRNRARPIPGATRIAYRPPARDSSLGLLPAGQSRTFWREASCPCTDDRLVTRTASETINRGAYTFINVASDLDATIAETPGSTPATATLSTRAPSTAGLRYRWSTGARAATIQVPRADCETYTVTVSDPAGCSASDTYVLDCLDPFTATATTTDPVCADAADGTIAFAPAGGLAPYTYSLGATSVKRVATDLPARTYRATVRDALGQTVDLDLTLRDPAAPLTLAAATVPAACDGSAAGSLRLTASGGWGDYRLFRGDDPIELRDDGTYATGGLAANDYAFRLVDGRGCTVTRTATVGVDYCPNFAVEVLATRDPCVGSSNGQVSLARTDVCDFPVRYVWADGDTSAVRRDLPTGEHRVRASTTNGCSAVRTITLRTLPTPQLTCSPVETTGPTGRDGAIRVEIASGARPLTILLDGEEIGRIEDPENEVSFRAGGLAVGTYTIEVVGANGCSNSCTAEVVSRPCVVTLAPSTFTERLACFSDSDGVIEAAAAGGVEPYTYTWRDGATGPNRAGLAAGTYAVDVIDASGCTSERTFAITEPALLEASAVSSGLLCGTGVPDGRIEAAVEGGTRPYSYSWNYRPQLDTAVATGLSSGDYIVTVTDAAGCVATASASFVRPDTIAIAIAAERDPANPRRTTLTATASGGTGELRFGWPEGQVAGPVNVVSSVRRSDNRYTVRVTDANGCTAEAGYTVAPPPPFTAEVTDGTVVCFDDRDGVVGVQIGGAIPGYAYAWHLVDGDGRVLGSEASFTGPAGAYRVVVTDAARQDTTLFATIERPEQRLGLDATGLPASCEEPRSGSITLEARGGWGGNSLTINGEPLAANDDGAYTRTGLPAGTYAALVSDERGCTVVDSVRVGDDGCTGFAVEALRIEAACADEPTGSILLPVTDLCGDTILYFWDDFPGITGFRAGLPARSYAVTAMRSSNTICAVRDTFVVPEAPAVSLSCEATETAGPIASDGTVNLRIDGPDGTYELYLDGQPLAKIEGKSYTVRGLVAGTYVFLAVGPAGCQATCTSEVTARPCALDLEASTASPAVSCAGQTDGFIRVETTNGIGALTFTWSDSSAAGPFRENLSPGSYTVAVADAVGCELPRTFEITEPDTLRADILAEVDSANFSTTLRAVATGGTPGYTYAWSGDRTGPTAEVPFDRAARYTLTVTDSSGCTVGARYDYLPDGELRLALEAADLGCFGTDEGSLTALPRGGIPPYTYLWNEAAAGIPDSMLGNLTPGNYTLAVFDAVGTAVSGSAEVRGPESALLVDLQTTPAACAKTGPTGTLSLTVAGGWGDPRVTINGAVVELTDGSLLLVNQSPDEFRVEVVDRQGRGCVIARTVSIVPESCAAFRVTPTEVFRPCPGERTGGARFSASDDCGLPLTYTWPDGLDTARRRDLAAGTYLVTARNSEDCTYELAIEITPAEPVAASCVAEESTGPYTYDGAVTLDIVGGIAPFEIWRDSVLLATVTDSTYRDGARRAGTYAYTVRAANGCEASCTSTVIACARPFAELPMRVSTEAQGCSGPGGAVRVTGAAATGYEYSLDTARTWTSELGARDLPPGRYQLAARSKSTPTCVYYTTTLTIAPDHVRAVRLGERADPTGCGASDGRIRVAVPTSARHVLLSLDGASPTAGEGRYDNLAAGRYRVVAEDTVSGCVRSFELVLATPAAARIEAIATARSTDCFEPDGTISLATAGASATTRYRIDGGAWQREPTFAGLAPGTYAVELSDEATGCAFRWGESVPVSGVPSITAPRIQTTDPTTCRASDGLIELLGSLNDAVALETSFDGGVAWGSATGVLDLGVGTRILGLRTAGDAAGLCVRYDTVRLVDGFVPRVDSVIGTDPWDCDIRAGVVQVRSAAAGQLYSIDGGTSWSGTGSFVGLVEGAYEVLVAPSDTACPRPLRSLALTERTAPPLQLAYGVEDALDCEARAGRIAVRSPERGVTYSLAQVTEESASWADLSSGTYTLVAQDEQIACRVDSAAVEVRRLPGLELRLRDSRRPSCYAESDGYALLAAGGGDGAYAYALDGSIVGAEISGLPAGLHEVTVIDGRGCAAEAIVDLPEVAQLARIDSFVVDLDRCGLRTASYDLTGYADSLTLTWTRPDGTRATGPVFETAVAGPHVLTVGAPDGCSFDKPFNVVLAGVDAPALNILAAETYALGTGGFYLFEISDEAPDELVWTVDDPRATVLAEDAISLQLEFSEPGEYTVEVGARFGDCSVTMVRRVLVTEDPILEDDIAVGANIQSVELYPNPHRGQFSVNVEVSADMPVYLEVINLGTRATEATRQLSGSAQYEGVRFDLGGAGRAGRYLLVARAGKSVRVVQHLRF